MGIAAFESYKGPLADRDFHSGMIKVGILVCIEDNKANLIFHQSAIIMLVVLMVVGGSSEVGCLNLVPGTDLFHSRRGTDVTILIGCLTEKIFEAGLDQRSSS